MIGNNNKLSFFEKISNGISSIIAVITVFSEKLFSGKQI